MKKTHRLGISQFAAKYRLRPGGESPIALIAIAAAAILLIAMAVMTWWSLISTRDSLQSARRQQVSALASTLGLTAETMLSNGDVSALRRLIAETRQQWGLLDCRVRLSDGRIVADADPTRITLATLPPQWSATPVDERLSPPSAGIVMASQPLRIAGRGGATLELSSAIDVAGPRRWEAIGPAGLICAAALSLLLLVYRRSRDDVAPIGLIREALLAWGSGETSASVLGVAAPGRPEAAAWNDLVTETEKLRRTRAGTQARDASAQLTRSNGKLEQACDSLAQGLIVLDDQGRITFANGAAAVFLQAKRDTMAGNPAENFIQPPTVREALRGAAAGTARQRQLVEVEQHDAGGTAVLRFGVRPLRHDQAAGMLITIEDITQQRHAESSRNSFVAQATHELRTPLTNIKLYLEMVQDEGENDPTVRGKCLNVIGQEVRRLEHTVGEMLSVAQIEAGSLEIHKDDVRLDKLFEELEADYGAQAQERKLELRFDLPPKLPVVQADHDKLAASLHNLVGNAIKYTPAGGTVTVGVRLDKLQLHVDVVDTGIGIDEKEQELVFARFYRAKDPRVGKITGSGLGLALARTVARLHGGDVSVQSRIDKGSTFTLTLPVQESAA